MAVTPDDLAQSLIQRFRGQRTAADTQSRALRDKLATLTPAITAVSRRAWLIGSLAKGTWGEHSDVDIVCEGISLTDARALERTLESELDVHVDLLRFEELDSAFRARVEGEGVAFHVA